MTKLLTILLFISLSARAQNSLSLSTGIEGCGLRFYCNTDEVSIDKISIVTGDTAGAMAKLIDAFQYHDSTVIYLLNIWDILKRNKFTVDEKYKDVYNASIKAYNNFHDDNLYIYNVSGSWNDRAISVYKNYLIRSSEAEYLGNIIGVINLMGFEITAKNVDEWTTVVNKYYKHYERRYN